jgi:hypothetical protein
VAATANAGDVSMVEIGPRAAHDLLGQIAKTGLLGLRETGCGGYSTARYSRSSNSLTWRR